MRDKRKVLATATCICLFCFGRKCNISVLCIQQPQYVNLCMHTLSETNLQFRKFTALQGHGENALIF